MQSRSCGASDLSSRTNYFEHPPLISQYENGVCAKPVSATAFRPCISNAALRSTATAEELIADFAAAAQLLFLGPRLRLRSASPGSSFALQSPSSSADATASPVPCSAVVPAAVPFPPFPRLHTSSKQFQPRPTRPP